MELCRNNIIYSIACIVANATFRVAVEVATSMSKPETGQILA